MQRRGARLSWCVGIPMIFGANPPCSTLDGSRAPPAMAVHSPLTWMMRVITCGSMIVVLAALLTLAALAKGSHRRGTCGDSVKPKR